MKKENDSAKQGEREAAFTTIVGGRPAGTETDLGQIPRGIEVLLKKASVDPAFRRMLLAKRSEAARFIGLELSEAEAEMLKSIPAEQLEVIIENTNVKPEHRKIFSGKLGKVMVAAVAGAAVLAVMTPTLGHTAQTAGVRPNRIRQMQQEEPREVDSNDTSAPGPGEGEDKSDQTNEEKHE